MTDKISLLQAAKEIGYGVTHSMLIGACIRGELRYARENTRMYVFSEDIEWMKEWFLERARLRDKEGAIGKYDMDGRQALRELAKERVRQGYDTGRQAPPQALPGRADRPGVPQCATEGGSEC